MTLVSLLSLLSFQYAAMLKPWRVTNRKYTAKKTKQLATNRKRNRKVRKKVIIFCTSFIPLTCIYISPLHLLLAVLLTPLHNKRLLELLDYLELVCLLVQVKINESPKFLNCSYVINFGMLLFKIILCKFVLCTVTILSIILQFPSFFFSSKMCIMLQTCLHHLLFASPSR